MLPTRALLAIQIVLFIAHHGQHGIPIKSLHMVERYRLNRRALEPVLQILTRAEIVKSKQGANGGYFIVNLEKLTLADVVIPFLPANYIGTVPFQDLAPILKNTLEEQHKTWLKKLKQQKIIDLASKLENKEIRPLEDIIVDYAI